MDGVDCPQSDAGITAGFDRDDCRRGYVAIWCGQDRLAKCSLGTPYIKITLACLFRPFLP